MRQRLHKILADYGIASRRKAEVLIAEKRVRINGVIISMQGVKADPQTDQITVDGRQIQKPLLVYYLFHKPANVVTSMHREQDEKIVADYFAAVPQRVYPVGRLDAETTGLLLMTNDGQLANAMMHPKFTIDKTYRVTVRGLLTEEAVRRLEKGVKLRKVRTAGAQVKDLQRDTEAKRTNFTVIIHEGKNRQIRRMCGTLGFPVEALQRTAIGPVSLGSLAPGKLRALTESEQKALLAQLAVR